MSENGNVINPTHEVRIKSTEKHIDRIDARLETMATKSDVNGILVQVRELISALSAKVETVSNQQNLSQRPQYMVIIGIITVTITVGAAFMASYVGPLNLAQQRIESSINGIMDRTVSQKQYDADVGRLANGLTKLDESSVTHRELNLTHAGDDALIDMLAKRVERLESTYIREERLMHP